MNHSRRSILQSIFDHFRSVLRILGFDLTRYYGPPISFNADELSSRIYDSVREFTITSPERVNALVEATKYVVKENIEGAFVECGVWKGGSVMAMALTLMETGQEREIFLYDTFSGMSAPTDVDGDEAMKSYEKDRISEESSGWFFTTTSEVERNIASTGYPIEKCHFIKGRVEDTIPGQIPQKIALLRLDTDFYESTRHELLHLFPILSPGGILIIDDYGRWIGAKKAVDEYIAEKRPSIFLNRIDSQGRIAVKMPD